MIRSLAVVLPLAAVVLMGASQEAPTPPSGQPAPKAPSNPVGRVAPATPDDLEVRPGSLTLVTDTESGQAYWVFCYTVVNKTGRTQRFAPRFELVGGDGKVLAAGADVPPAAQRRLQRRMGKMEAFDQFQIMGEVLEGEVNARDGFAVWPAKQGDSKELTLFLTGFSRAQDTRTDASTGQTVTLRRTLQRSYSVPGQTDPRVSAEAPLVAEAWIMR
jgi:hypothetical protein